MSRRTKIVATLGPATDSPETLEAILRAGVDVVRINFSHGQVEEHLARIRRLRDAAQRLGKFVAILADLPGPKLRVRMSAARWLQPGETIRFARSAEASAPLDLVLTEPEVLADVRPGHRLLLDDGRLQLVTVATGSEGVTAEVVVGGELLPNKGVNLPDTPLTLPPLTLRDHEALRVAAQAGVDWVAVSFVRSASAAEAVRSALRDVGLSSPILAKIERPEAVEQCVSILAAFDGAMVARGDLGVELPLERVPTIQKMVIAQARAAGKPVITATDMLDSMRAHPRPTRAEASDVANAIFDGTDAVMLSGETAVGQYPVEAVQYMHRIAWETERHLENSGISTGARFIRPEYRLEDPISLSACHLASEIDAAAIVTPTLSGNTARLVARYRPWARIVALSPHPEVLRRLALIWGVVPVPLSSVSAGGDRLLQAVRDAFAAGALHAGERIVLLAGHPIEGGCRFPTLRIVRVGPGGESLEP